MAYNDDLLTVIDDRIAKTRMVDRLVGTVSSRSTSIYSRTAMVTLDGSSVAMPCKVVATVSIEEGDRVLVERFGADWVVVAGLTVRAVPSVAGVAVVSPGGTMSSGTYTALPGTPEMTFHKRWDETDVLMHISTVIHTDTVGTFAIIGQVWIEYATNFLLGYLEIDQTYLPLTIVGSDLKSGIPAGDYTVQGTWVRGGGPAGSLNQNTLVRTSMWAMEVLT